MSDKPIKVCPKCKAKKVEQADQHDLLQAQGWRLVLGPLRRPEAERREGFGCVEGFDHQRSVDRFDLDHQIDQRDQEDRGCRLSAGRSRTDHSTQDQGERR